VSAPAGAPGPLRRGFIDVSAGQVHVRSGGAASGPAPLVLFHASPLSSRSLAPLMRHLGAGRPVYAFDTPGNGDSSPPARPDPDIPYLAGLMVEALDGLGLGLVDLYGTHTGANLAIEIAAVHRGRVRRVVLDGVALYTEAERQDRLARYAPEVAIREDGSHLPWAWGFVRDLALGRTDRAPAEAVHEATVELLKSLSTYHLPYRAAFRYRKEERLRAITAPTLVAANPSDVLYPMLDRVMALVPGARRAVVPGTATPEALARTAAVFGEFLDA
jgi:pimeloyl-ACP methyl ester carboxylesterase